MRIDFGTLIWQVAALHLVQFCVIGDLLVVALELDQLVLRADVDLAQRPPHDQVPAHPRDQVVDLRARRSFGWGNSSSSFFFPNSRNELKGSSRGSKIRIVRVGK